MPRAYGISDTVSTDGQQVLPHHDCYGDMIMAVKTKKEPGVCQRVLAV